jgi:hypothetical protein
MAFHARINRYLRANGHASTPIVLVEIPPKCESDWYNTATLQKSESYMYIHQICSEQFRQSRSFS